MSDGQQMEWSVPVETLPDRQRRELKLVIEDGDVVMVPPKVPCVVPPSSDELLLEGFRKLREIQRQMGRGLT